MALQRTCWHALGCWRPSLAVILLLLSGGATGSEVEAHNKPGPLSLNGEDPLGSGLPVLNQSADASVFMCTVPVLPPRTVRTFRDAASLAGGAAAASGETRPPNIIMILTDDQSYDDLALHHPNTRNGSRPPWINTPNLDRFVRRGVELSNFYVTPQCAQSRAQLLTGRSYPKTGTLEINGGWDCLSRKESTLGELMLGAGYTTAHFGKWHNGFTLGYEPWSVGFQESWLPQAHVHLDNIMRWNGVYIPTDGLMEERLMDRLLNYIERHRAGGQQQQGEDEDEASQGQQQGQSDQQAGQNARQRKPFFVYYAPHAIHMGWLRPNKGPRYQRPAPPEYLAKYRELFPELSHAYQQLYAFLEYLDAVLGRLFDYLDATGLSENTYVFLSGDNGAAVLAGEAEDPLKQQMRIPSHMVGYKGDTSEGGWRQALYVRGPGLPHGLVDHTTLLSLSDLAPTFVDLAGGTSARHLPFDGVSFASLLRGGLTNAAAPASSSVSKGDSDEQAARPVGLAAAETARHNDRYVITIGVGCFGSDLVPELGGDRQPQKPQPLLDLHTGGPLGKGYTSCIGARYRDYKWTGRQPSRVWRFPLASGNHIERPCNEVDPTSPEHGQLLDGFTSAMEAWWADVVASPHSFKKPTFYLGLDDFAITNILGAGAIQRTHERVVLLADGASGFSEPGDEAFWRLSVLTAAKYGFSMQYASRAHAKVRVSIGTYAAIRAGVPLHTSEIELPEMTSLDMVSLGAWELPARAEGLELQLQLISSHAAAADTPPDQAAGVFQVIQSIRVKRLSGPVRKPRTVPAGMNLTGQQELAFQTQALRDQVHADNLGLPESLFTGNDIEYDPDEQRPWSGANCTKCAYDGETSAAAATISSASALFALTCQMMALCVSWVCRDAMHP